MRTLCRPLQAGGLLAFVAAILVTLTFNPQHASAAVAAAATPSGGLTDQQVIHVQGSGLPPNQVIHVLECVHAATTSQDCEGFTDDPTVSSDGSGNYDNPNLTVYVLPDSADPTASITCDSTHACDLYVGDDFNNLATSNHAMVPISFATAGSTTTTAPTAATTTTLPGATTTTSSPSSTTSTTAPGRSTTSTSTTADPSATTTTTAVAGEASGSSGSSDSLGGSSGGSSSGGSSSGSDAGVSGSNASSGGSALPFTAAPPLAPWLGGFGLLAMVGGTITRRSALRELARQ